jgi:ATP-dependent Clp protease ATP-binding subunit ClpA
MKEEVGADDIAEIISKWTGIPITKMLQSEKEKLLDLEDYLHQTCHWTRRSYCCCFRCNSKK